MTLLNCVWELGDASVLGRYEARRLEMLSEEHEGFARFSKLTNEHVTASEMMGAIAYEDAHRERLGRYII